MEPRGPLHDCPRLIGVADQVPRGRPGNSRYRGYGARVALSAKDVGGGGLRVAVAEGGGWDFGTELAGHGPFLGTARKEVHDRWGESFERRRWVEQVGFDGFGTADQRRVESGSDDLVDSGDVAPNITTPVSTLRAKRGGFLAAHLRARGSPGGLGRAWSIGGFDSDERVGAQPRDFVTDVVASCGDERRCERGFASLGYAGQHNDVPVGGARRPAVNDEDVPGAGREVVEHPGQLPGDRIEFGEPPILRPFAMAGRSAPILICWPRQGWRRRKQDTTGLMPTSRRGAKHHISPFERAASTMSPQRRSL